MIRRPAARVAPLALALAAAACDDTVRLEPVFELPTADDAATPRGYDDLVLSIARAGSPTDLTSRTFRPGERVELSPVQFGDDLVVHLSGVVHLANQAGDSVVAYGRTCTFSVGDAADPPSPHLWFSRNLVFASLALAPAPRTGGFAVELEGAALVLGGGVSTVERFDPRTGALDPIGELAPRAGAAAAPLGLPGTQRLAVVGGTLGGAPAGVLELLQPAGAGPAQIARVDDARLARTGATATTLTDGRVIVVGGRAPGGAPTGDLIELLASGPGAELRTARAALAHPRAGHSATRLGDDVGAPVLIAGGADATGAPVAIAELWKPLSGDLASPATFSPSMIVPRSGHRAELMPDGSVLFIGGVDAAGQPIRMLERFAIDAGFVAAGELPATAGVVEMTTTRLPDGRILIAGGRPAPGGPAADTAFIARLDVVDGTVDVVPTFDRLAAPRAGHHAVLLCDGTVWLGGGAPGAGVPEAERYNPPPTGRR